MVPRGTRPGSVLGVRTRIPLHMRPRKITRRCLYNKVKVSVPQGAVPGVKIRVSHEATITMLWFRKVPCQEASSLLFTISPCTAAAAHSCSVGGGGHGTKRTTGYIVREGATGAL